MDTIKTVAELNDAFRRSGMGIMLTSGVVSMPDVEGVIHTVQTYTAFNCDNDPYDEHDFGSFEYGDTKILWKIDCYDENLEWGLDPRDPKCRRILTIMRSNEY